MQCNSGLAGIDGVDRGDQRRDAWNVADRDSREKVTFNPVKQVKPGIGRSLNGLEDRDSLSIPGNPGNVPGSRGKASHTPRVSPSSGKNVNIADIVPAEIINHDAGNEQIRFRHKCLPRPPSALPPFFETISRGDEKVEVGNTFYRAPTHRHDHVRLIHCERHDLLAR
ncbi:MAG: hypothetical protein KDK08_23530 [Rhizobiaceae bacterium]|nr:hypothetical protein [Rhizobiaceae bacterium]